VAEKFNEEIELLKKKVETGEELTSLETYKLLVDSLNVIEQLKADIEKVEAKISATQKASPYYLVKEFHEVYGLDINTTPVMDIPVRKLRVDLVLEEAQEYKDAELEDDFIEMADALADIVYVAYGAAIAHGIDLDDVLLEVQRSNLSKLHHETGLPIYREDGKVLKGENFFVPDIRKVLTEQGWIEGK